MEGGKATRMFIAKGQGGATIRTVYRQITLHKGANRPTLNSIPSLAPFSNIESVSHLYNTTLSAYRNYFADFWQHVSYWAFYLGALDLSSTDFRSPREDHHDIACSITLYRCSITFKVHPSRRLYISSLARRLGWIVPPQFYCGPYTDSTLPFCQSLSALSQIFHHKWGYPVSNHDPRMNMEWTGRDFDRGFLHLRDKAKISYFICILVDLMLYFVSLLIYTWHECFIYTMIMFSFLYILNLLCKSSIQPNLLEDKGKHWLLFRFSFSNIPFSFTWIMT